MEEEILKAPNLSKDVIMRRMHRVRGISLRLSGCKAQLSRAAHVHWHLTHTTLASCLL